MSNEQRVYIGAYLEVIQIPYNDSDYTTECPEHGCIRHLVKDPKFCPLCGEEVIKIFTDKDKYLNIFDIMDTDDVMQVNCFEEENGKMILVCNYNSNDTHAVFDENDEGVFHLHNSSYYIERFHEKHAETIRTLEGKSYIESVKCKYGAVIYWY